MYVKVIGDRNHHEAKQFIGQTVKAFAKVRGVNDHDRCVYLIENPTYNQAADLFSDGRNNYWELEWQDPTFVPSPDANGALVGYMWVFRDTEAIETDPRSNAEAKILLKR